MTAAHPDEEWIKVPQSKTNGFARLLSLGANRTTRLMQIKPDVVLSDQMLKQKPAGIRYIYYPTSAHARAEKRNRTMQAVDAIVVMSDVIKSDLIKSGIAGEKIHTIYAAPSENELWLDWHQKYSIKQQNSDGKEFFIARADIGPDSGWEILFRAFSAFKKWQQTEVQLLISAEINEDFEKEFDDRLASYKYRSDVKVLDRDREFTDILPAAYGVIIHYRDSTGMDILNSFKAGVPVITSEENIFHEAVSGSFLPAARNSDEVGRQIINLYRDEHLRDMLAETGKETASRFSWQTTTQNWFDLISKFAG